MKTKLTLITMFAAMIFALALFIGPKPISPFNLGEMGKDILISIRLPRIIVSILMGMALGASGAVLQGILRNPLADPYILGISSGASLTAAIGIIAGLTFWGIVTIPLLAFTGALITGIFVGAMGWKRGGFWPERLLLAGGGLGFLFLAMLMLLMSISSDEGLRRATLWIFGALSIADWSIIPYGFIFIALGLTISIWRAKALNALIFGDEVLHSLCFFPPQEGVFFFLS